MFRIINTYSIESKELKFFFPHEAFDFVHDLKDLIKNTTPIQTLHLSILSIDNCYIYPRLGKLKELLLEDVKIEKKIGQRFVEVSFKFMQIAC